MPDENKLQKLSLASLMVVREIIKRKSLTEASRAIGISQPAASQQLSRFEKILGHPVIVRRGNELVLKDAAAAEALDQVASGLEALVRATQGTIYGSKPRLGVSHFVFKKMISGSKTTRKLFTTYDVIVQPSHTLVEMFHNLDVDLVYRVLTAKERDTELQHDCKLSWVNVNSALNPRVVEDTDKYPLLLLSEESIISQEVEAFLRANNIPHRVAMRLPTIEACYDAALSGLGYALVPLAIEQKNIRHLKHDLPRCAEGKAIALPEISHGMFYHKKLISYLDASLVFENISAAMDCGES